MLGLIKFHYKFELMHYLDAEIQSAAAYSKDIL